VTAAASQAQRGSLRERCSRYRSGQSRAMPTPTPQDHCFGLKAAATVITSALEQSGSRRRRRWGYCYQADLLVMRTPRSRAHVSSPYRRFCRRAVRIIGRGCRAPPLECSLRFAEAPSWREAALKSCVHDDSQGLAVALGFSSSHRVRRSASGTRRWNGRSHYARWAIMRTEKSRHGPSSRQNAPTGAGVRIVGRSA
jgi:hypothetical protein